MRIDQIRLANFRAFEDVALALESPLTLLVGRNGAGKSTVLEGIAVALGAWLTGFAAIHEDHPIDQTDARTVFRLLDGAATAETLYPVRVEATGTVDGAQIHWARELRGVAGRTTTGESASLRAAASAAELQLAAAEPSCLPLVAYYGAGRLWIQKREKGARANRNAPMSRLNGYRAALAAASDHKGFEAWMKWREEDRVQRLAFAAEQARPLNEVATPDLDGVSAAACACLEGARRMYFSVNHQELRVDFEDGATLPFRLLSDGQRNLIAVAADIAWRATQLNPHLGAEAPRRTTGVVLIDEVDLHLHPAWQSRVLDDLLRAFPALQFIVTSHSPQVMSSAPKGSVRIIDREHHIHPVTGMRGRDTNTILEDILEVPSRPTVFRDRLALLARHIEDGHFAEARTLIGQLEADLDPTDTDLVAATWELELAEKATVAGGGDAQD